jgi:hypothetical protein
MPAASGRTHGPCTRSHKRGAAPPPAADDASPSSKRQRPDGVSPGADCALVLYVRCTSAAGATRMARLPLDPIAGVADLRSLFRRLVRGAYPGGDAALPDFLTCPRFYKFAPAHDFVELGAPGAAACTQFRLAAAVGGGREVTLAERRLGGPPDPARNLLVTVAEFESPPVEVGGRRVAAALTAYPAICVRRQFLDGALRELRAVGAARRAAPATPTPTPSASSGGGGGGGSVAVGAACSLSSS